MALETFLDIISTYFSKRDANQSENQDILFHLHFGYLCHVFSSLVYLITLTFVTS